MLDDHRGIQSLRRQAKYDETRLFYEVSLRIRQANLGEHRPLVARTLNNLAALLHDEVIWYTLEWPHSL